MAKRLKTYEPVVSNKGRPCKYPYNEWFDGQIRRLFQGTMPPDGKGDFECTLAAMEVTIRRAAKFRGIDVSIFYEHDPPALVIQAILQASA